MNRIILSIFAITACFAIGHSLKCYKCDIGFWNLCLTTETTCGNGELCFSGVGEAAKVLKIRKKGCLEKAQCNQTTDVRFPIGSNSTLYKMTFTCCDTDLCNAAPGLSRVGTLPLALGTLLTLLTAKAFV